MAEWLRRFIWVGDVLSSNLSVLRLILTILYQKEIFQFFEDYKNPNFSKFDRNVNIIDINTDIFI